MHKMITIRESIEIKASKLMVWNFTQDFDNRPLWDHAILDCKLLQKKPVKLIWLKTKGGVITKLKYKLCDRFFIFERRRRFVEIYL